MFAVEDGQQVEIKVRLPGSKYLSTVGIHRVGDRLWLSTGFNKDLTNELKVCLSETKWHGFEQPPIKKWSCAYSEHTRFQLSYLSQQRPYARFDEAEKAALSPLSDWDFPLRPHQQEGVTQFLKSRRVIWAYEMGLGKSLMAIQSIVKAKPKGVIWVAPRSALLSVRLEYAKWGCDVPCLFLTYDGLKSYVQNLASGTPAPKMLIADEAQKVKTWTSQRSQTFRHLTKSMREEHGDDCYIALMSGTPAPRTPIDWFAQCEAVVPGFIREADIHKFRERLDLQEKVENQLTGGVYPRILTWLDDENKCAICGRFEDEIEHDTNNLHYHHFKRSVNEVAKLYDRMRGLVMVRSKKDCTTLPEKIYQRIYCKPSRQTLESARLISSRDASAIMTLTHLRELSDGFQYIEEVNGKRTCDYCEGKKQVVLPEYIGPDKTEEFILSLDPNAVFEFPEDYIIDPAKHPILFENRSSPCPACNGSGEVDNLVRADKYVDTAKDKALVDIIEEHDEVGRLVVYAGFTASVTKLIEIFRKQQWEVIKLDGSGWFSTLPGTPEQLILQFQDCKANNRIAFIANQGSGSTGITLTASPTIVYYSNTFNAEDRMQSEDRIHRLGMDENRGARIVDLIHLPSDEYVLENLLKKKDLQNLTLGSLAEAMKGTRAEYDYE